MRSLPSVIWDFVLHPLGRLVLDRIDQWGPAAWANDTNDDDPVGQP